MSAAAMASLQRELYAGEEEEYATPPRVPAPGEIIEESSETSDGTVPADPVSGQSAGQEFRGKDRAEGGSSVPRPTRN